MSDTLEVFGHEFTNVAGIKAYDDNSQLKTYIRPQGTKSINASGTGIDVTEYASVDVNVQGGSTVTVTPNLSSGTKVATITVDGSDSDLYAPTPPTKTSDLTNDSGFLTEAPVTSVNGETGTVTLDIPPTMTILSYGTSTWAEFMEAYSTNTIVYCRASSNSNPASGSKTRMAFMAYVNNETAPTNVEFQYYRSVSSHTATQQGDQVYVYKLDKNSGWSVITREAKIKMAAGNGLTSSFASNTLTIKLPDVTAADNGKVLQVVNGAWAVADLQ